MRESQTSPGQRTRRNPHSLDSRGRWLMASPRSLLCRLFFLLFTSFNPLDALQKNIATGRDWTYARARFFKGPPGENEIMLIFIQRVWRVWLTWINFWRWMSFWSVEWKKKKQTNKRIRLVRSLWSTLWRIVYHETRHQFNFLYASSVNWNIDSRQFVKK